MEEKDLKTFAKEAKIRFKRGFWKNYNEKKQAEIDRAKEKGINEKEALQIQIERAKREIKTQFDEQTLDDVFYEKVAEILKSDEIILNPITRLIDHDVYDGLNDREKQKYILDLTEKFNEMKKRYEKERMLG